MSIVLFIVVGLLLGYIASSLTGKSSRFGLPADLGLGMLGAFTGLLVAVGLVGNVTGLNFGFVIHLVLDVIGAAIFLTLLRAWFPPKSVEPELGRRR